MESELGRYEHRSEVNRLLKHSARSLKVDHRRSHHCVYINCLHNTTMPSLISPHVLGAIALVLWLSRLVLTAVRSPVRSIPGPRYSRFTQAVLKYHTIRGRRMYYVDDLHSKYGPIVRIAPDEAAVSSLQATQMIHKVGSGFNKSSFYDAITAQRRDSEPGIFSMRGGKPHAARRKLFARPFSQNSLRANWESVIQSKVRLAVNRILGEAGAEGEADILKWWTLMATDVIAHLSFGESFRMLELGRVSPRCKPALSVNETLETNSISSKRHS